MFRNENTFLNYNDNFNLKWSLIEWSVFISRSFDETCTNGWSYTYESPSGPTHKFWWRGVRQRFIFYTQKDHNFRICLPKKITVLFLAYPKKTLVFFSQPKKIPLFFFATQKTPASFIDLPKSPFAKISHPKKSLGRGRKVGTEETPTLALLQGKPLNCRAVSWMCT